MISTLRRLPAILDSPQVKNGFIRNTKLFNISSNLEDFGGRSLLKQQSRQFRSSQRKVSSPANAILSAEAEGTAIPLKSLVKPLVFTLFFSTGSIAGAALLQYETMRAKALASMKKSGLWFQQTQKKAGAWRQYINERWATLSDGEKLFVPIFAINAIVFAIWHIPRCQPMMVKYFCSNPAAKVICWPMVLSTFSHYSVFHLLANMFVLYSFSAGVVSHMGKEQFLGMYMAGGVISSFTSYLHKASIAHASLSLGASGAIMSVLGYVCSEYPETRLSIIFLPMFTFSAGAAIKVIMGIDLAGILLGWKFFDHAAHLGGALWGIAWCYWGNEYIWKRREPLLQFWHNLRNSDSSR